ncbi:hypothetical protein Daesc_010215 [Daldinia eschscholtzii]|uniref:C3H1-type domain-containing protein n=1 Tax=Daldinia eschscholtzii TaxID=292717 RepID=A0AAX6M732_9PEZI
MRVTDTSMANPEYVSGGEGAHSQQRSDSSSPASSGSPPTKNQIPLPHYFIVRPGTTKITASGTVTMPGPIVPLIAVDQLPKWLELLGVPRELSVEQTVGLRNLGTVPRDLGFYKVYMNGNPQGEPAAPKNHHRAQTEQDTNNSRLAPTNVLAVSATASPATTFTSPPSAEKVLARNSQIDPTSESINNNINYSAVGTAGINTPLYPILRTPEPTYSPPPPPPPPPPPSYHTPIPPSHYLPSWYPPSRKPTTTSSTTTRSGTTSHTSGSPSSLYCKHWCHRGTCRWGAQCRYAHSMPATPAGLRDVGLAHHPAWYTTAVSMAFGPGGFINPNSPNNHHHHHHNNHNTHNSSNNSGNNGAVGWCPPQSSSTLRYHDYQRAGGEMRRPEKRDKGKEMKSAGAGVAKGKEKEKEKEGDGKDGKSKCDKPPVEEEAEQSKEDAREEKASAASAEEQTQQEGVEKLVEI